MSIGTEYWLGNFIAFFLLGWKKILRFSCDASRWWNSVLVLSILSHRRRKNSVVKTTSKGNWQFAWFFPTKTKRLSSGDYIRMKIWNRNYFIYDLWKNSLEKMSPSIDCLQTMKTSWFFSKKKILIRAICSLWKWNSRLKKIPSMFKYQLYVLFFNSEKLSRAILID